MMMKSAHQGSRLIISSANSTQAVYWNGRIFFDLLDGKHFNRL